MKILITGAGGNVGRGVRPLLVAKGHELVLHDVVPIAAGRNERAVQGDCQFGDGLIEAAAECEVIVHLPAWHGVHWREKTERDYWRLNVDGTFFMFQAALAAGVRKVVFLSSIAWYGHYDKYGFTKVIGEELCEYYHRNHHLKVARVRPGNFTPWSDFIEYGSRFIGSGGVDREDVLDIVVRAIGSDAYENEVFHAQRDDWLTPEERARWDAGEAGTVLEAKVPGAGKLASKYKLDWSPKVGTVDLRSTKEVLGWRCRHDYLTFLRRLQALDAAGGEAQVRAERCGY